MQKNLFKASIALNLLKNDYVLSAIINDEKFILIFKNNLVNFHSKKTKFSLNEFDFLSLYSNEVFSLIEEESETIDKTKDEEYYSYIQKRQ